MSQFFLSFDTQDALAEQCASWIVRAMHDVEVVVPQQSWALGSWTHYLQTLVSQVERIIIVTAALATLGVVLVQL
jgi:hypothetical protein